MDNNSNSQVEGFLLNWFPNCEEMLKESLGNSNIMYYPYNSIDNELKAFDFVNVRNVVDNEENFISVDKEQSSSKQKPKQAVKKAVAVQK